METIKTKIKNARPELEAVVGSKNLLALPRLVKVVVGSGVGRMRSKERNELVNSRLSSITGQKASPRGAKKSIASFKLREGEVIGHSVTLRGNRMYAFVDKLINVAIPRTRDFRGISISGVDKMGNLTIGIKEHIIFPETADEDLRNVFGFSITFVTTAKNKSQAETFFKAIGIPFKKEIAK
ncbi:MAG: 50S ribosomal protein L5 [bacterium]|nr:50S ribosomal protein L5 [bacterium]